MRRLKEKFTPENPPSITLRITDQNTRRSIKREFGKEGVLTQFHIKRMVFSVEVYTRMDGTPMFSISLFGYPENNTRHTNRQIFQGNLMDIPSSPTTTTTTTTATTATTMNTTITSEEGEEEDYTEQEE